MAKMEQYIFNVDADTSRAVNKLQEINRLMDQIDKLRTKGSDDYFTTTQKDMDKNMRSMSKISNLYKQLNSDLNELKDNMREVSDGAVIPDGATKEQVAGIRELKKESEKQFRAAQRQQEMLRSEYNKTLFKFREMATFQQNYSKNFKHVFNSKDLFNMPTDDFDRARRVMSTMANEADGVSSKLDDVKAKIQEVNKLERRTESQSRRASASKYMSFQQSQSFNDDNIRVSHGYVKDRENNMDILARLGMERSGITKQIKGMKGIENNPEATQADIDKKIALQGTIQAIDKEMESRFELNRVLERTIGNMKKYNESVQGVEVKPERGTFKGMMYERAPAIGLALGGAAAAVWGGLYSQGAGIDRGMRDDVISMGQRTGTAGADWRSTIRDGAFGGGLQDRLGFTGQQMLDFQNNYMSNAGFDGMDDLNAAANAQGKFSRTTGLDAKTTQQLFDSVYGTGAVNGKQSKDIQDAFVGAIKNSGMEGREKDQAVALSGILDSVKQGRSMTNADAMNVMGIQSLLAQSGNRSLSGESGGQLLTGLNEGIRQGFNDPMVRMIFGQGTQYQGLEGRWALRQQMEKGVSDIGNVNNIASYASQMGNGNGDIARETFASFVQEKLGTDITSEQADGIMDMYESGKLTQESLDSIINGDKAAGGAAAEEKFKQYQDSHEAANNESDVVTEKQAANLYDFGDAIREANSAMGGWNAAIYATTVSLVALAGAAAASAGMFGIGRGVRKVTAGTFGGGGGFFGRLFGGKGKGGPPTPPTGGGGLPGGGAILGPNGKPLPPSGGPQAATPKGGIGGWFKGLGGGTGGGGKFGNFMKGAGGIAGKAMLPLAALMGIGSIMAAPEGQKAETTGSVVGGIGGGMLGGAAAGALAGSVVPGIGTVIGGIGGGILGSLGGSALGGWVGSKFGADKASAAELPKANEVDQQVDRESTNTKERVETKKTDNLSYERENLNIYETLLNKAQQLLQQARSQGGIFGAGQGIGNKTTTGTTVANLSGSGNAEKIWGYLSQQGFSSEATAGIMGNLMQESGLDPNATNSNGAYGIGQWMGGRKKNLEKFAEGKGLKANSLEAQLQFLMHELEGGDSRTASILNENGGLGALKGSNNVDSATSLFEKAFERSGGDSMGKRQNYADGFYDKYSSAQFSTTPSNKSGGGGSVKVDSTITVNVKGDEKVSDKVNDKDDITKVANLIQSKVYGSMDYYSKEMRMV